MFYSFENFLGVKDFFLKGLEFNFLFLCLEGFWGLVFEVGNFNILSKKFWGSCRIVGYSDVLRVGRDTCYLLVGGRGVF